MYSPFDKAPGVLSRISPAARTAVALAVLVAVFADVAAQPVFFSQPPPDEITWVKRSLAPWLFSHPHHADRSTWAAPARRDYFYATHHPAVVRIVYGTVLLATGNAVAPKVEFDYDIPYGENLRLGNRLPAKTRLVLRLTNACFVLAALVLVFLFFLEVSSNRPLSVGAVLALIYEPTISKTFNGVLGYIGADAVLLFMLVLFWFAWVRMKGRSAGCAVILGVLAGVTTATKVNGSLVLVAAMAHAAFVERGKMRFARPLVLGTTAVLTFIALNPVYWGSPAWMWSVLRDTVRGMYRMQATAIGRFDWVVTGRWELFNLLFPYLPFAVVVAALLWRARREWWFGRTAAWAAALIGGNLACLVLFLPTYAAPLRVAFLVVVMAAGLHAFSAYGRKQDSRNPRHASPAEGVTA